jgi:hypothetical protein
MTCWRDAISCFAAADGRVSARARAFELRPARAVGARGWARLARLALRRIAALALGAGVCATARSARAADASLDAAGETGAPLARSDASERSGGLTSLALHAALSFSTLSEDDVDEAELVLAGADLDFALGLRLGERVRLAYEATLGFRTVVGVTRRYEAALGEAVEGQVGFLLPLGACLELRPDAAQGPYGSVHVGGGVFRARYLIPESEFHFAGRIALDLGWQLALDAGSSLGISARYSLLGMKRVYLDEDYNDALVSHELSAGVQWNF